MSTSSDVHERVYHGSGTVDDVPRQTASPTLQTTTSLLDATPDSVFTQQPTPQDGGDKAASVTVTCDSNSECGACTDLSPAPHSLSAARRTEGVNWRRWFVVATHAACPLYFGLKTALLANLPTSYLVFSDTTGPHFIGGALMPLWATANSFMYVGHQINMNVFVFQSGVWMMIWGTFTAGVGAVHHEVAWWCLAIVGMMFTSLFTNLPSRRLLTQFTIVTMMMQRLPMYQGMFFPFKMGGIIILGISFATTQSFLPYPLMIRRKTDEVYAQAYNEVATIASQLRDGVWSGRAFSGYVSASLAACDELAVVIDGIPGLVFLCAFEPLERSVWNQLRGRRLALLKRLLVILYATCTSAQLVTSMTTTQTRANSVAWKRILKVPTEEYLQALAQTMQEFGSSLEPSDTVMRCHFDVLQEKKDDLINAIQDARLWVSRNEADTTSAAAFYSFLYFHLMLVLLSEEMRTFADQMQQFDPATCKSTVRRFFEFFVLDFWDDFRNNLLDRLLLRTEESRRSFKLGVKLTFAYTLAAAFTLWLNNDNMADTYYFGMSIIFGGGLPTASESFEIGTHRIAAMMIAVSIGYMAVWKTNSFAASLAVSSFGTFLAVCFRNNKRYMHVAWYSSFIIPAAYAIASDRVTLISKVVDNSLAVTLFCLGCLVLFPINSFRVFWNTFVVLEKSFADTITQLAWTTQLPLEEASYDVAAACMQQIHGNIRLIIAKTDQLKAWTDICVKEPVVFGPTFPSERVSSVQVQLSHIAAALEVWLFGLQILYRNRACPPHAIVHRMIGAIALTLRDVEAASRVVFQELINCVDSPYEWTPFHSVQHMSDFVEIKTRFHETFQKLHKEMMAAQNAPMRRSMRSSLPAQEMQNRSFIGTSMLAQEVRNYCPASMLGDDYHVNNTSMLVAEQLRREVQKSDAELAQQAQAMGSDDARHTLNLSFRAPSGALPIDIDVSACTIVIVSVATILSSLEAIVPHMQVFNSFERGRQTCKRFSLHNFFMKPTA